MHQKLLLGLLALIAIGSVFATSGGRTIAAATLTLRAGAGETGYAVNVFLPPTTTVNVGDTLTWNFPWFEPHSVTFGQPAGDPSQPSHPGQTVVDYNGAGLVNSGLVFGPGPAFTVRFTAAGSYPYFCFIHPNMTAVVDVVTSGRVDSQLALDIRGSAEYERAIRGLKELAASLAAMPVAVTPKAGGGSKYSAIVAGETLYGDDMQFFPPTINIKTGDSVEWKSSVHAPHMVTFGLAGPPPGDPFETPLTKPAATYDGTGFWHSSVLGIGWPGGLTFEMTFSKAGSYQYVCILHAAQGMRGTVIVSGAPGTAPAPPATGTGLARGDPRAGLALVLGLAALVALVAGSTVFAVARE